MISYYIWIPTDSLCIHLQQTCRVCSSEKVDKWARYAEFLIASMPYPGKRTCAMAQSRVERTFICVYGYVHFPWFYWWLWLVSGCEFFKEYRDSGYDPVQLQFNWSQVPYSGKLLRVKTFATFEVLWLFGSFLREICGRGVFWWHQQTIPESFFFAWKSTNL